MAEIKPHRGLFSSLYRHKVLKKAKSNIGIEIRRQTFDFPE